MKKVIILRKILVRMKSSARPLSTIERTEHFHASDADLLHTVLE